jgi:hypothetical protein
MELLFRKNTIVYKYIKAVTSQSNTMEPMIPLFNRSMDFAKYTMVMGLILSYSFKS